MNSDKLFCYECACFKDINVMNIDACGLCGGYKCFLHGGKNSKDCTKHNIKNVCIDCQMKGLCDEDDYMKYININKNITESDFYQEWIKH